MNPRAIITAEELHRAALDSISTDLETADDRGAVTAIATAASRIVENHLGRRLMVHLDTLYLDTFQWESAPSHPTYSFRTYAPQWPLVERTSTDVVVAGTDRPGAQFWYSDSATKVVTGYIGYKRADQSLAELQGLDGLSLLATLPTDIPEDIRDCAIAIGLAIVQARLQGQFGNQQTAQTIGSAQVSQAGHQLGLFTDILSRINAYRIIV